MRPVLNGIAQRTGRVVFPGIGSSESFSGQTRTNESIPLPFLRCSAKTQIRAVHEYAEWIKGAACTTGSLLFVDGA